MDLSFYKGKKVLITGHTGFKGSWMTKALLMAGAEVTGYALEPPTEPALFDILGLADRRSQTVGRPADWWICSATLGIRCPETRCCG